MWLKSVAGLLVCICLLFGIIWLNDEEEATEIPVETEKVFVQEDQYFDKTQEETEIISYNPVEISVFESECGEIKKVHLEDYLVNVLAGEMPASYEPEALKAQAVAARTYIAWKRAGVGCKQKDGADVCTDSMCCMAYWDEETMAEHWGDKEEAYLSKLTQAVKETAGEILLYDGEPIQAVFHASSGGFTEDAVAVWGQAFPYLQSVTSAEDAESEAVIFSKAELAKRVNTAFPTAKLTKSNAEKQLKVLSVTSGGRVERMQAGKITLTGKQVRETLGLRSAAFSVEFSGDQAIFTVTGYGHGVGLSQLGAEKMAQEGAGYREILMHYYSGVEIGKMGE